MNINNDGDNAFSKIISKIVFGFRLNVELNVI